MQTSWIVQSRRARGTDGKGCGRAALEGNRNTKQVVAVVIELFHHIHHAVHGTRRKEDPSIPPLPEERNPIFFVYPICITISIVFMILWLVKVLLFKRPEIVLVGCFGSAVLMLIAGIMEMKHTDTYIDLTDVDDEELLTHPVFIHNFIMCLLSIFCMVIYLVQAWAIFDYWIWIRKRRSISKLSDVSKASTSSTDTDIIEGLESRRKVSKHESKGKEEPGEPHPIATLEKFPSLASITENVAMDDEKVIFYCCFVDWYRYAMRKDSAMKPVHEFQVIHVM